MPNTMILDGFYPARLGKKWGYVNRDGVWVIAPVFDAVFPFNSFGIGIVVVGMGVRLIDKRGRFIGNNIFDAICPFERHGVAAVEKNGVWSFVRTDGKYVTNRRFTYILPFSNCGKAAVVKDDLWGYISSSGELVVKPRYTDATAFCNGYAAVKEYRKWKVIDSQGNIISAHGFEDIHKFSTCGLAAACEGNRYGYIDTAGKFVIPPRYLCGETFYENGTAWVKEDRGWYLINDEGEAVCDCQYEDYEDDFFSQTGIFSVKKDGKWGVIDRYGHEIIPAAHKEPVVILKQGFFARINDGFRYISKDGKETGICFDSFIFNQGEAHAEKHPRIVLAGNYGDIQQYGYINVDAESVIAGPYEEARPFSCHDVAEVRYNGEWYVIDAQGEFVTPPRDFPINRQIVQMSNADQVITYWSDVVYCINGKGSYEMIGDLDAPYRYVIRAKRPV